MPGRQPILIRHRLPDQESEARHFLHSCEIPVVVIFVGRLMIVLVVVLFEDLVAVAGGLAVIIGAQVDGERRHTRVREREMVGPVEDALLGMRVGLDRKFHAMRGFFAPPARLWFARRR